MCEKWRNAHYFGEEVLEKKGEFLLMRFVELKSALRLDLDLSGRLESTNLDRLVCWEVPPSGWVLLNINGAAKGKTAIASGGGSLVVIKGNGLGAFMRILAYAPQ